MINLKKILVLLILLLVGCDSGTYKQISASKAHDMIDKNEVVILDVRETYEYETGHLKDAINIPFDELEDRFIQEVTDDKSEKIIIYCQSGSRAQIAAETLVALDFKNVYTFGGIDSWNYEIEK